MRRIGKLKAYKNRSRNVELVVPNIETRAENNFGIEAFELGQNSPLTVSLFDLNKISQNFLKVDLKVIINSKIAFLTSNFMFLVYVYNQSSDFSYL